MHFFQLPLPDEEVHSSYESSEPTVGGTNQFSIRLHNTYFSIPADSILDEIEWDGPEKEKEEPDNEEHQCTYRGILNMYCYY